MTPVGLIVVPFLPLPSRGRRAGSFQHKEQRIGLVSGGKHALFNRLLGSFIVSNLREHDAGRRGPLGNTHVLRPRLNRKRPTIRPLGLAFFQDGLRRG